MKARVKWFKQLDEFIITLRMLGYHPYYIADQAGLLENADKGRQAVEIRLAYLAWKRDIVWPKLAGDKPAITPAAVRRWREWVNTGKTQSERCAIKREIALQYNVSYETVHQRLNKALAESHTTGERNERTRSKAGKFSHRVIHAKLPANENRKEDTGSRVIRPDYRG